MKTVSLVVRAVGHGKLVNLCPEQARARNHSGTFYIRWSEGGNEKWVTVGKDALLEFQASIARGKLLLPKLFRRVGPSVSVDEQQSCVADWSSHKHSEPCLRPRRNDTHSCLARTECCSCIVWRPRSDCLWVSLLPRLKTYVFPYHFAGTNF
jgi:hypothetical protein